MKWSVIVTAAILAGCTQPAPQASPPAHLSAPKTGTNLNPWAQENKLDGLISAKPEKKIENDGDCDVIRIRNSFSTEKPQIGFDLKCTHINLSWWQYREDQFKEANREIRQIAEAAAQFITGDNMLVSTISNGEVLKHHDTPSGFKVSGSCQLDICLLTFSPK